MLQPNSQGDTRPLGVVGISLLIAIAAAATAILFFAPRFAYWQGFSIPEADRAYDTLRQLEDPFAPIPNINSRPIEWRLFFPLLGNLARLGDAAFFSLAWIGCLATLSTIAWYCRRAGLAYLDTLLATTLCALSPWYFVSTGWLGYFDSWLVLCMLLAALSGNRAVSVVACLIGPWIDERFVLGFPVVLLARFVWARQRNEPELWGRRILIPLVAATALYPLARIAFLLAGLDGTAPVYVQQHLEFVQAVALERFAVGLWYGHRVGWLLPVALAVYCFRKTSWREASLATGVLVATALGGLLIASDMQRSLEMLFPACIVGLFALRDLVGRHFRVTLFALVALGLTLPAAHFLWTETFPIDPLWSEVQRPRLTPAQRVDAAMRRAHQLAREADYVGALQISGKAIEIDPGSAAVHLFRSSVHLAMDRTEDAAADVERAMRAAPECAECAHTAGMIAALQGEWDTATRYLRRALNLGGPDWPARQATLEALSAAQQQASRHRSR